MIFRRMVIYIGEFEFMICQFESTIYKFECMICLVWAYDLPKTLILGFFSFWRVWVLDLPTLYFYSFQGLGFEIMICKTILLKEGPAKS